MANIIITGSTKGIGRGLATEFIKRNHNVLVCGRKQDEADRVATDLTAKGPGQAIGQACDVTDKGQVEGLWTRAIDEWGRVDFWINNAGRAIGRFKVHELPANDVETLVSGNLMGTVFGSQVAISGFRKQGSGALYNMLGGSFDGKAPAPQMGVYSSTKAGVYRLTRFLLDENKDEDIMIGMISPGMLITENWFEEREQLSPGEWEAIKPTLNILCDYVETATPWLVDQILANQQKGKRIAWLTGGRMMKRFFDAKVLRRKRDLFTRFGL